MNNILTELTTIRDFIRYGVSRCNAAKLYFGHGTDNVWDDVVALVMHVLHLTPDTDNVVLDAKLTTPEKHVVLELLDKRVNERLPIPYLTNTAYFGDLTFYVDNRVLIPRSPLIELIHDNFSPWIDAERVENILDIGTGCGCIAIACAYAFPEAQVTAVDISPDALDVAKRNVSEHHLEQQVRLIESDVFANIPKPNSSVVESVCYDVIVSNPPYVAVEEMTTLPKEYCHEPQMALVAGNDGLSVVDRILWHAADYLAPNGVLIVEVGNSAGNLMAKYPQVPFTWLEFACGEAEVFLLTKGQLKTYFI